MQKNDTFWGFVKKWNNIYKLLIYNIPDTKNDPCQVFFVFLQHDFGLYEKVDCFFVDVIDVGDAAGCVSTDGACRT